ncbi:histidine phosphatase family protein [Rarobacter incanus]|nr:histidine phosphatase family protein [Rarobacter incanus]
MVLTTVHLVRHGEVFNPDKILYGRLPGYHLSDRGKLMADRLAEYFADGTHDITELVSSPLQRAQETMQPIAAALGLAVRIDERLIEASNYFEGKTFGVGDGSLRHPQHWPHLINPFKPSWGEPYKEQVARMHAAVADARNRATGHEAVLVSHQLPIWIARLAFEDRRLWHDPRKRECSLASVTSLHFAGDSLKNVTYAEPASDLLPGASTVPGA